MRTVHHRTTPPARTSRRAPFALGLALITLLAAPLQAEDESRLQIHGFLTQAWATADYVDGLPQPSIEEISLGIPEDGTFDYRHAALQLSYRMGDGDRIVVQLSTRALGENPIDEVEDEIELDWAFYQHALGPYSALKVGRIQIPFGLWNEVRDVGTLLPFYRPPIVIYGEGSYTSETVDGLLISHVFGGGGGGWNLEASLYGGQFEVFETNAFDTTAAPATARADDVAGAMLWLRTPVDGLLFGAGGLRLQLEEGTGSLRAPDESQDSSQLILSAELDRGAWVARGEIRRFTYDASSEVPEIEWDGWYLQAGWRANEHVHAFVQYEGSQIEFGPTTSLPDLESRRAWGVSLHWRINPAVVAKAEHHFDVSTEAVGGDLRPLPGGGFVPQVVTRRGTGGSYSILSLSVSF